MELTSDQFARLASRIYDRLGLSFDEKKLYFVNKRVEKRMQALGIDNPDEYLFLLGYGDKGGAEMQALANLITNNETYMFREFEQLEIFANLCLPDVLSRKQEEGSRTLRIWCAGCSTGEEAYTLSIIVQEVFPQIHNWNFEIAAIDIDENCLAVARAGRYGDRSVKGVPPEYLERHFIVEAERYTVRPRTASFVSFRHMNLHDRLAMRTMSKFDFIFCRNVLIYFDDASRKSVVDHMYNALNRGGYIFLGHSESVGRISTAFRLKRVDGKLVYTKE